MEEDVELRPFVCLLLFNGQRVDTEKIPKDLARIFNDLFERRQEGDYTDFVSFQESQVTASVGAGLCVRPGQTPGSAPTKVVVAWREGL